MNKNKICLFVGIALTAVLTLSATSQATLLTNDDFETGDGTGWMTVGTNFAIVSDPTYSQNTYSATLLDDDTSWSQCVSGTEGVEYTLSSDIIHNTAWNNRQAVLLLEFWDAGETALISGTEIGRLGKDSSDDTWFSFSGSAVAPTGTGLVKVILLLEDGAGGGPNTPDGQAYWDNVVLTPEPATVALLGLGGLFMLRRKRR
jgi:hypothetical protein